MIFDKAGVKVYINNPNFKQKLILIEFNFRLWFIGVFYLNKVNAHKRALTAFIDKVRPLKNN